MSALDARLAAWHSEVKAEIARVAGVRTVATMIPLTAAAWVVGGVGVALLVAAGGVWL